jgi:hypothetical protein
VNGSRWGGRLASEWVAGIDRNQWPLSIGIGGRLRPEYPVNALVSRLNGKENELLKKHFDWFVTKYIVLSKSPGYPKSKYTHSLYNRYKNILWK